MPNAIRINGTDIGEDEIAREIQYHPAGSLEAAWKRAATALAVRELLRQRAAELAIEGESEDDRIEALLAAEVQVPPVDEETCRRWFERNRDKFPSRTFEGVEAAIASYIADVSWATVCGQYVRLLVGRARIEGLDVAGADGPLLQ